MKKRKAKKKPFAVLILLLLMIIGVYIFSKYLNGKNKLEDRYLANDVSEVSLNDEEGKEVKKISRGTKVSYYINQDKDNIAKIKKDNDDFFLDKKYLVNSINETVLEKEVYVRTSYNLKKDIDSVDLL